MDHNLLFNQFKTFLKEQNLSENTIRAYLSSLRNFFGFCPEPDSASIQLYKLYLIEHYKPRTVNLRIHALNRFLRCFGYQELCLSQVKIQKKTFLEQAISHGDYEYLKAGLLRDKNFLSYFIIRFMAATGARISETLQLTVEDVRLGYKDVFSKGCKNRRIYIPVRLQEDMLLWLKSVKRPSGCVFLSRIGGPLTDRGVRKQLKTLARRYSLEESVMYPHSFRHLFARNFIRHCDNISLLSNLLGHKSLETTRIYLQRTAGEQKQIVNQVVDW